MPDSPLRGRRILVVEDEYMLAMDLERELQDAGAQVLGPVPSVAAALQLVESTEALDGALLDVNLGGEEIYPVAEELLARGVPVVLTTGYDHRAIPERFADVPRCEKPVDVRHVARTLGRLVDA